MTRVLAWFSAGAASAVATKLALAEHGERVEVWRIDPGSEHPDNERFAADCARWFGVEVRNAKSGRYADTWEVWAKRRFLVGPSGALCTTELKKMVRHGIERPDDVQVFGYTAEEAHRADRFREQNPGVELWTPLIDVGLTKSDCLAIVDRAGIEMPAMYQLGYKNNNCIGCPKGGMGYWNKIRRDFPDVFERMAALETELGATVLREQVATGEIRKWTDDDGEVHQEVVRQSVPLPLHQLDPNRGNHADEPDFECSLMCAIAEDTLDGAA